MSLEIVQNACAQLKSAKVTERKKGADRLMEILSENEDICRNLDHNSMYKDRTGDKVTWTTLFMEVRDYFFKETDKLTSSHIGSAAKNYCFSVVDRVFYKGTCHRPWIGWKKIFDFLSNNLAEDAHASVFGPALMSMLHTFLSTELYVSIIDGEAWIDLIKLLVKLYPLRKYQIDPFKILQCLNIAIQEGSNHSAVIPTIRCEIVNFYGKIFTTSHIQHRSHLPVILRGVTSLSRRNAVEFRGILCRLGEVIIPTILGSYSHTADEEVAIVEFLLVQLQLHSPCDCSMKSEAFFAEDPRLWVDILKSIYGFCLDTLDDLANKKLNHFHRDLQVSDRLLLLAAKCTKQICDEQTFEQVGTGDEDDPNPTKKSMRYRSFQNVITDICSKTLPNESLIVWMNYVTAVLTQFPYLMESNKNFCDLFHLGMKFMRSAFVTRRDVYVFFICLLGAEKQVTKIEAVNGNTAQGRSRPWDTAWELTIRSLSVCEFKTEALELLRKLLIEVQPTNVHSLLISFTSGNIPVTPASLTLLAEYLSRCTLPIYIGSGSDNKEIFGVGFDEDNSPATCPRSLLARWLVNHSGNTQPSDDLIVGLGHEPLISTILCSLLVRQTHNLIVAERFCFRPELKMRHKIPSELCQYETVYEDFEKMLLKTCFIPQPKLATEELAEEMETEPDELKLSVIPKIPGRLIEHLAEDFERLPTFDHQSPEFMKKFSQINYRVALYLNITNLLEKHSVGVNSGEELGFRTNVEKLFDKAMSRSMECATDFITKGQSKSASQIQELISFLRNPFRCSHFCESIKVMLAQRFPQHLQELLKKVYRSNLMRHIEKAINNPNESIMFRTADSSAEILARILSPGNDDHEVSESRQIELAALESLGCLIDYGIICDHRMDLFVEIIKDCISETYNSYLPFIFEFSSELVTRLIPVLSSCPPRGEYSDILTQVTNLLQKMCRGFYQVPQCTARLWELFADITPTIARDTDVNKMNLMILVGTLTGFLKTGSPYGSNILICQVGFRALSEIAKHDRQIVWSVFTPKNGRDSWILNETYGFLNNPSHLIRIFATDTICHTFEHAEFMNGFEPVYPQGIETKPLPLEEYFDKTFEFIDKTTFESSAQLGPEEALEDAVNRIAVALSCLSRLIFAYPFIQKKTLLAFIHLVKKRRLDISLANRALTYSSPSAAQTMCCHISYLLHMWLNSGYAVDTFPFRFFGCESLESFYKKFRCEISVEFFQKNDIEGLTKFSQFFGEEPTTLIKECYAMLIARVIPGVAVYKTTGHAVQGHDNSRLLEMQKRLTASLGGNSQCETLIAQNLGDVVLQCVSFVFDPSIPSTWGLPVPFRLPEPSSPYYDEISIDIGLKFLQESSSRKDISLVAALAMQSPRSIYDISLNLIRRVHNSHDALEKFWRLHQFSYFVKQLFKEQLAVFNMMKEYVCQFVVHGYIRLLKSENGDSLYSKYLRESLVHLISHLVLTLTLSYKEEMKEHFYAVVNCLVSSAVKYPELLPAVIKPLDHLFLRYSEDFRECILSIDPFPTNKMSEFQPYMSVYLSLKKEEGSKASHKGEWTLFRELRDCLKNQEDTWTLERLQRIRQLLSENKRDMEKLVRVMEERKISDDFNKDVVHNIIQSLLSIVKTVKDEAIVREASRCLGEIGPIDLSVLVLPRGRSRRKENKWVTLGLVCVVELLSDYLKDEDIQIVAISSEVLRSICHTEECNTLISTELAKTKMDATLKPFKYLPGSSDAIIKTSEKLLTNVLEAKLGLNEMNEYVDYSTWIIKLTCGLLECFKEDESMVVRLLPICRIRVEFCQAVLPFVFYILLFAGKANPLVRKTVAGYYHNFFTKCVRGLTSFSDCTRSVTPVMGTNQNISIYTNKLALRSLLGVIQYLRLHSAPQEYKGTLKLTPWDNNFWLDVNYFDLAKAAQHCGAYLTSILFSEIAVNELETSSSSGLHMDEPEEEIDAFYSQGALLVPPRARSEMHERLLLKAYTSIGETDAVYGCGSARFSDGVMNIRHLQQRKQYFRVLSASDGSAVDSESMAPSGIAGALKDLALNNTLWAFLQGMESKTNVLDPDLTEIQYECGWRLSKWDLHCDKSTYLKDTSSEGTRNHEMLQRFVYESVKTGLSKDVVNHIDNLNRGYKNVARTLRHASIESSENLYGFLSQFQMIRIVENFFEEESKNGAKGVDEFLQRWKGQDRINHAEFKFQEPLLSLRSVLLHSYGQKNPSRNLDAAFDDTMMDLLVKARDLGRLELAEHCVNCISGSPDRALRKDLEIAKNHWAQGDQDIARHMLGKLIKKSNPDTSELYPHLLLLHGDWLSKSMSERPAVILEKYFLRSCQIFEKRGQTAHAEGSKAHFVLAGYADAQYQNVVKYMKSDIYAEKKANVEKARMDVSAVKNAQDKEVRQSANNLIKQTNIDQEEITKINEERKRFLVLALTHYLKGLKDSNDQDLLIFRAVALWLENAESTDVPFNKEVNNIIKTETLPCYKFVVVLHQLSARLTGKVNMMNSVMMTNLEKILSTCIQEHPYHTLPVLLTQALLHYDQSGPSVSKKTAPKRQQHHMEDRVTAASKIVDSFRRHRTLGPLTNKMERLWQCLIDLANIQEPKGSASKILIPNTAEIKTLRGLEIIPVPTYTIPVSATREYHMSDNGFSVGIASFDATYNLVGGINSPKRIACIATNGEKYNMLLKGHDDLRQDAVMQQVFNVMNRLLLNEPKTKGKRLHVRTYRVVPLSQRTGILEWCENTQTLGDYLAGDEGAHIKYRPTDYKPADCRRKMIAVKDCGDNEKKFTTFMTILEHFKPVLRHFFFENFKDPGMYFERRLAYTRSVATNAMVGYILGLGDRHVMNILIDKTTAEQIHIDLGIAFEQGMILPTPETIPFRLTRDVVDGMGVSGVEGVFRKSCEMTLEVLRNSSEIILTILEVLLYDPLYMWTLTTDRMQKAQPTDSVGVGAGKNQNLNKRGSVGGTSLNASILTDATEEASKARNSSAARVLLRLRQKLAGIEEGGSSASALSVSGHVSMLIQRAMDPERLSRLFAGWQPYL